MNPRAKDFASRGLYRLSNKVSYKRTVFLLGHMRCGSTALTNVLCANPHMRGYGECHVVYDQKFSSGKLALNLIRNRINPFTGEYILDKILHNELDQNAHDDFFDAKAIFLIRQPMDAVVSLINLSIHLNWKEYRTPEACLSYYVSRLNHLRALWPRFAKGSRNFIQYESLVNAPETQLEKLSKHLLDGLTLNNQYSQSNTHGHGKGDALNAHKYKSIAAINKSKTSNALREEVGRSPLLDEAEAIYQELVSGFCETC